MSMRCLPSPSFILTRPVGRVQPAKQRAFVSEYLFQSSPGPWAECNNPALLGCLASTMFQSSPGPWAECNNPALLGCLASTMFQSSPGPWAECNAAFGWSASQPRKFQSSPGPWAECNVSSKLVITSSTVQFQSSPGPWAECNTPACGSTSSPPTSFNPHPARGPSATCRSRRKCTRPCPVSILTRPVGRVQHR